MAEYYFISGLPSDLMDRLRSDPATVEFELDGHAGCLVEDGQAESTLAALGLRPGRVAATSLAGIYQLHVAAAPARPEPTVPAAADAPDYAVSYEGEWEGAASSSFLQIAEEFLLPYLKKNIVFHVPHGNRADPLDDGQFHIWIWSSATSDSHRTPPPKTIWGTEVNCRDGAFLPSGDGAAIVDDANYTVAELVGDNLFVHHDLVHHGHPFEFEIFSKLCDKVLSWLPEESLASASERAKRHQALNRERYIRECGNRLSHVVQATKDKIAVGHDEIASLQQKLVRTIRETIGAERKLEQLAASADAENEKFGREYDRLLDVPKVVSVTARAGLVSVCTDTLYCNDPRTGKRHEIGKFRIEIQTDGRRDGIRWNNLSRRINGYEVGMNAPHVFASGKACLGNIKEVFPSLIGNWEFAAAAMVAIQFIETVNAEDPAGKYIDRWPEAPKEECKE